MHHFSGILCAAKNEIIVLSAIKFPSESASFLHNTAAYNKEMTDIIIGTEQIKVEIRFQMRLKMFVQFCRNFIFIRI